MIAAKDMVIAATQGASVMSHYSAEQIDLLRNQIAPGFTDAQLAYGLTVARARGLDPFKKEVYFSKRKKKVGDAWVDAVTVEPTIDGFRVMAARTQELNGYDGPYWCGEDGQWRDVWLAKDAPAAAKITVYRKGQDKPYTAVARFASYAQLDRDGKPLHMWQKMPDNQLAKCAESLALRKAFPEQLGEFYTREEMEQADAPDRFAQLPQEAAPARPQIVEAPKPLGIPPPPDVVDRVPPGFALGKFKPLGGLEGVPFGQMEIGDLELVVSLMHDNRAGIKNENARKWAVAIEAAATDALRDAKIDTMDVPPPTESEHG